MSVVIVSDVEEIIEEEFLEYQPLQEDQDNNSEILLSNHLRCASHTLSLLATTDFQNILKKTPSISRIHHPCFAKCTALWNASRRPKSSEQIHETLGCQLMYPCPTRWNSCFDSVGQLLTHKNTLNILLEKLNLEVRFKEQELEYLEEFHAIMKPIAAALDSLQAEKKCYYGQLLPTLISLKVHLKKLDERHLRHTAALPAALVHQLTIRFEKFFSLSPEVNEAILATCFHPCFKLRWFPEDLPNADCKRIEQLCSNALELYLNSIKIQETDDKTVSSEEDDGFFVLSSPNNKKTDSRVDLEIVSYFNDRSRCLSSLNNYHNIKKLFIKYNTSLCSSAAVERLFSFAGFIHSPARGSLSDSLFEKLVFLKGNMCLK